MSQTTTLAAGPGPDRILRGGVVGMRGGTRRRAAIAFLGARIVAAGDEAAVLGLAGPTTEIVDLGGAPLIG